MIKIGTHYDLSVAEKLWIISLNQIQSTSKVSIFPRPQNSRISFYVIFQKEVECHVSEKNCQWPQSTDCFTCFGTGNYFQFLAITFMS